MERPRTRVSASVIETPQPQALATFYEQLLGWDRVEDHPAWVRLKPLDGTMSLSFSLAEGFVRPVWPATPGEQQMMTHLDVAVENLEAGVAWASELGASLAEFQPQNHVRVMLDPDGHPFCLFVGPVD